jgi:hypothetical protein
MPETVAYYESDTGAKLIDPAIHACRWTEPLMRFKSSDGLLEKSGDFGNKPVSYFRWR